MPARTRPKPDAKKPGVLFLHGEETLLAEEMIANFRKTFFASEEERDGFLQFSLRETNWTTIIETVQTGSLFYSGKKLVLVILPEEAEEEEESKEEAEARGSRGVLSPFEEEKLREFITSLAPEDRLIIYYPGRIDRNNSIYRLLHSLGPTYVGEKECKPLKGMALKNWVVERLERQGMRIEPEALNCLVEAIGNDLNSLARELEKLALYCARKKQVELADVAAVCPAIRAYRQFELTQAMEEGNRKAAFQVLSQLLEDKGGKEYTVGALAQFFRELLLARQWLSEGKSEAQIFEQLRPQLQKFSPDFVRQKRNVFFRVVNDWNEEELVQLLSKLRSIDQASKSGSEVSEVMLFELIHWFLDKGKRKDVFPIA